MRLAWSEVVSANAPQGNAAHYGNHFTIEDATMRETILTDDEVIDVTTTVRRRPRRVDWSDIETTVEYDDCYSESPWESCDGYEHDVQWLRHPDDNEQCQRGYGWSSANRQAFVITIDDSIVINKWGHTRRPGESKQTWLERVAFYKAQTIDQLVKWYSDGWEWYVASASYGDYRESVGGIDSYSYAEQMAEDELRWEVAATLERAGFIIQNKPEPKPDYSKLDAARDRFKRQLTC
jgi:hypothetical protein